MGLFTTRNNVDRFGAIASPASDALEVETNFTLQLRDAFQNPVPHIDGTEVGELKTRR